jgi:hypothetical protein
MMEGDLEKVNPWPTKSWPEILRDTNDFAQSVSKHGSGGMRFSERIIEPVFGRYITRNAEFREELEDLAASLENYARRPRVKRPFNILLSAGPGSGKSFLLKQLAQCLPPDIDVEFDEYHVSAFRSVEDIYGAWQRVQSANLQGKLPFVFFDEVDGEVEGRYVLANFLAAMWDGLFHIGKDSFALGRAIFAFAASNMLPNPKLNTTNSAGRVSYREFVNTWNDEVQLSITSDAGDGIRSDNRPVIPKCRDFVDRIDRMICIPPVSPVMIGEDFREELLDIACLLVKKHFEEIQEIEESALIALVADLMESSSRRSAERCVFCARPNATRFGFSALPKAEQLRFQSQSDLNLEDHIDKWVKVKIRTK